MDAIVAITVLVVPIPQASSADKLVWGLKVKVQISEKYQATINYRSLRVIQKSQSHDDEVASENVQWERNLL